MKLLLMLFFAFILAGCSASALPLVTPSGKQGFTINCSNMNDISWCYKKAGELCGGKGYKIYSQTNKSGGFWTPPDKQMVISCK